MRKTNKRSPGYKTKAELKKERKQQQKQLRMEKKYLIGIYDQFRKEGILNGLLPTTTSKLIGTYSTQPIYNMYYLEKDNNCVIEKGGNSSIKIEVWEISETALVAIEREYCYYSEFTDVSQDYKQEKVNSPFGDILLYTLDSNRDEKELIIDGDWVGHLNQLKV